MNKLAKALDRAENVKELFEVVKDAVRLTLNESRAGLDLGLAELGNGDRQLLSAYYPMGSNIIVMNKTPLKRIMQTKPGLLKPYSFIVLLHEYLHSLGYVDEETVRVLTYRIANSIFNGSVVTDMARDLTKYFPYLLYPGGRPAGGEMDVVEMEDVDYIG